MRFMVIAFIKKKKPNCIVMVITESFTLQKLQYFAGHPLYKWPTKAYFLHLT